MYYRSSQNFHFQDLPDHLRRHRPYRVEKDIAPGMSALLLGDAYRVEQPACHQVLSGVRRHSDAVAGPNGKETSASIMVSVSVEGPGISKES